MLVRLPVINTLIQHIIPQKTTQIQEIARFTRFLLIKIDEIQPFQEKKLKMRILTLSNNVKSRILIHFSSFF